MKSVQTSLSRPDPASDSRIGIHALLAAALERLLAGGASFQSISVDALSREAGIARSSFYLHFRNKNELVGYLLAQVRDEIAAAAGNWFAQPERVDRRDIDAAVRGIIGVYEQHYAVMHAAVETAPTDPVIDGLYREILRQLMRTNRRTVARSTAGHPMQANVTQEVGDALLYMIERCSYQLRRIDDPAQRERLIQALGHVAWHSLFNQSKVDTDKGRAG